MIRKFLLPLLAIFGAIFGLYTVFLTQKTTPVQPILFPPARSPYQHSIAAAGIIEASTNNISIGSPFNEIIKKVYVIEGQTVKSGDQLFELDVRNFQAELGSAEGSINVAKATLEDRAKQFSFYKKLQGSKAVSEQIYQQASYAYIEARESLKVAQANLNVIQANIEKSIILAPVSGKILQVNIHVGEIAPVIPAAADGALILMGSVDPLQMRVDIDEDDAWRFIEGMEATAFVRGNRNIGFAMKFIRVEPYIIPKRSFTGITSERVDTRVLQVLYQFEKKELPIYAGQILDVFIKSTPHEESLK